MNPLIGLKTITLPLLIALLLVRPGLSPRAQAVSPPPDGGYPNENTAEGQDALFSLTSGDANTAIGFRALFSNTTGGANTATGVATLVNNTTGSSNTATGVFALANNRTGNFNTATGVDALFSNTTGNSNTATGVYALVNNSDGNSNTANGLEALLENTTGDSNTAVGFHGLHDNTIGIENTAIGSHALGDNTTGIRNTAIGSHALGDNTTGIRNTAVGSEALAENENGSGNTATGNRALHRNRTGSFNVALGAEAGANLTTGDNNIDIGNPGVRDESNTIHIGTQGTQTKTFIAGISDAAIGGMEVRVNQNDRLGTVPSSKRFKEVIKAMDKASEVLLALRPVTFRYKPEIDPEGIPQFGLIAEEVEKINPDLVVRDPDGKAFTVRYDAVNTMLLNEFLKEHRTVQELKANAARQEAIIARQQKQIEALTAGLQKVSAQLEGTKPAPQVVNNSQ
jgi:hypothetical protein